MTKMGTVTESIFSGKDNIIPMADVQNIEKYYADYNSADGTVKKGQFRGVLELLGGK